MLASIGYIKSHTCIVVTDAGTIWSHENEGPPIPEPLDRWSDNPEGPQDGAQFNFKKYEFELLAAYAQCFRGQKVPSDLPMIPAPMADLIIRAGGLTEWINSNPRRLARFWRFVEDQSAGIGKRLTKGLRRKKPHKR